MGLPYHILQEPPLEKLEQLYHKGHTQGWNGKAVLASLVEKHGLDAIKNLEPSKRRGLQKVFALIFWGEYAAWQISLELARTIEAAEPKMAAVSQAHDEARHFYVMRDYLQLVGEVPKELNPRAAQTLDMVLRAPTLAKQLLGMQLMVEPVALTVFQLVRQNKVEPILCDLLAYFERDEARHVTFGVHYLPIEIRKLSRLQMLELWLWQARIISMEIDTLREFRHDLRALGIDPQAALRLGQQKQLASLQLMLIQMGSQMPISQLMTRLITFKQTLAFSERSLPGRFLSATLASIRT